MSISYGQTPGTSMAEAICQLYTCMSVCLALPGHPQFFLSISRQFIILCLVIYPYNHSIAARQAFRIQNCCCHYGLCKCEDICFHLLNG